MRILTLIACSLILLIPYFPEAPYLGVNSVNWNICSVKEIHWHSFNSQERFLSIVDILCSLNNDVHWFDLHILLYFRLCLLPLIVKTNSWWKWKTWKVRWSYQLIKESCIISVFPGTTARTNFVLQEPTVSVPTKQNQEIWWSKILILYR